MKKILTFAAMLILIGAGCTSTETISNGSRSSSAESSVEERSTLALPVPAYVEGRTVKAFGEHIEDRFHGYHVGEDIEYGDIGDEIPVTSIADGEVVYRDRVSGYGGVVIIEHQINGEGIRTIYGHLDLESIDMVLGDEIGRGEVFARLGDHESEETDGERKHLHFAMYSGEDIRLDGYVRSEEEVLDWMNPQAVYLSVGDNTLSSNRRYSPNTELGGEAYGISFLVPEGHEVEYVPSIQSLNIFSMQGEGSARERSQVFIRYFDASDFLTLSTVTIHETRDLIVGEGDYTAREYDIEKNEGVTNFLNQPIWRNERHIVTDFRERDGFTRYYVVAANPDLDPSIYQEVLDSLKIEK
jgi:murein DD-endopeptidase MepM/ murein hydrolase activator NlpD